MASKSGSKRDYYEVLQVTKTATVEEIHKSYKVLAKEHHPDRNGGSEEAHTRFVEIQEAYTVLKDEEKRNVYDRYGHAGLNGSSDMGSGFGGAAGMGDLLNDLIGGFFGGGGGRQQRNGPRGGRDIQQIVDITFIEAYTGVKKSVSIDRMERCGTCNGNGTKGKSRPATCTRCGGSGAVLSRQGFFQVQQTCRGCDGRGTIITDPCGDCRGQGRVKATKTLEVDIPGGVDTGMRIQYRGEGEAGEPGAPRGDLEIVLRVAEHPDFQRDGNNLVTEVPITISQAVLGGELEIPLLTHSVKLTLPKGLQSHQVLRIANQGMPNLRGGGRKGDLLVQIVVETPTKLTPRQEELFRELAEIDHKEVSPARKSFFERLKGFFSPETKSES